MCAKIYDERWKTIDDLPKGGQAYVYKVEDLSGVLSGTYVLKRLINTKRIPRFQDEIKALQSIDNEHILKIIDYNLDAKQPYLVTEYCDGGSLSDLQESLGQMEIEEKFRIGLEICIGLNAVHHHDPPIYHRDLKPDNIYLRGDEKTVVIGDFGLCFIDDEGERQTLLDEAVGSRYYMHPELEDGGVVEVKPYHDLYSLGKVFYWIFSDGKMFSREKHREIDYDLADSINGNHFYEHLYRLLDKMIVNDSSKAIHDVYSVGSELQTIQGLMLNFFNPIGKKPDGQNIKQKCNYCGIGEYIFHGGKDYHRNWNFLGPNLQTQEYWEFLQCNHCGNVQMFKIMDKQIKENWNIDAKNP